MIRLYLCLSCDYSFSRVICNNTDADRKVTCPLCGACGKDKIDRVYIKRSLTLGAGKC